MIINICKQISVLLLCFFYFNMSADNRPGLSSRLISKELLSNADLVIRESTIKIEWKELNKVVVKKRQIITVINNEGLSKLKFYELYNNSTKIKNINALLYDSNGNTIDVYDESYFSDRSHVTGMYSDDRIKYINPVYNTLPFTVEFSSVVEIDNSYSFQKWKPLNDVRTSIQKSSYTFINPNNYEVRINQENTKFVKNNNGDLVWSLENVEASLPEKYSSSKNIFLPTVEIAPVKFEYEGIKGEVYNWSDFGKWAYDNLIEGQNNLTQTQKGNILGLVEDDDSDYVKAKKIYSHMQKEMRYINVSVGIGGYQPISAKEVAECGYGDCKGLSNYTMAALETVGVEAIYAKVYAGKNKIGFNENFVSGRQSNHIILCLPNIAKDTLWLECTSKDSPFGYLGDFTDDRKVLLITDKGGIITKTPDYSEFENSIIKNLNIYIDKKGNLEGKSNTKFSGNKYNNHIGIGGLNKKDKQVALAKVYSSSMQLNSVEYIEKDSLLTIENINFYIPSNSVLLSDKTFLFNPYILKNNPVDIYRNRDRKSDIVIYRDRIEVDSVNYKLPMYSKVEAVPKDVFIDNKFGTFIRYVVPKDNSLIYYRKFKLKKGVYPKEEYKDFYKFIRKVNRSDNAKVMMYL